MKDIHINPLTIIIVGILLTLAGASFWYYHLSQLNSSSVNIPTFNPVPTVKVQVNSPFGHPTNPFAHVYKNPF